MYCTIDIVGMCSTPARLCYLLLVVVLSNVTLCTLSVQVYFRNYSVFGFIVTESGLFKVCLRQRARFLLDIIYTFLRTLQQVQSPRLNCYVFSYQARKSFAKYEIHAPTGSKYLLMKLYMPHNCNVKLRAFRNYLAMIGKGKKRL